MSETTMDWVRLFKGDCPKCMGQLVSGPEYIVCNAPQCRFMMHRDKFFSRVKKHKSGYWAVMHRSRTEDQNMMDLSQL